MSYDLLSALLGKLLECLFRDGQHSSSTDCSVIEQIGPGSNLIHNWEEHQASHELHSIAWRPVLSSLLIVFLVELSKQLLEDSPHPMVVEARMLLRTIDIQHRYRTEIDGRIKELLDQRAERVGFRQSWDLISEFEVLKDVLDVR